MSLYAHIAPLPRHRYVWVEPNAIGKHGWLRAVWFGLVAYPGRMWGCNMLLECGAMYRNVPLHQIATVENAATFHPAHAQMWDCYGYGLTLIEYPYLSGLDVRVKLDSQTEQAGEYLFSVAPVGDGFSAYPEQAKEFMFCTLETGRITAQPTNRVLIEERSFTTRMEWPRFLERQTEIWSVE